MPSVHHYLTISISSSVVLLRSSHMLACSSIYVVWRVWCQNSSYLCGRAGTRRIRRVVHFGVQREFPLLPRTLPHLEVSWCEPVVWSPKGWCR